MKQLWHLGAPLATLCFAAALAGCGGNPPSDTTNSAISSTGNSAGDSNASANVAATTSGPSTGGAATLTGEGATFPAPLYKRWFDLYNQQKSVKIDYSAQGSGAGIKQLTNQTVDFGASDAPPNAKETAGFPSPVVTMPSVAGAVVVTYNLPGAPKGLKMTGQTIAGIYLGKIKTWNDPAIAKDNAGAKLPASPIAVVHRADGSGTSFIFTNFLSSASPEWKGSVGASKQPAWPVGQASKGNAGVAATVKSTPNSIGYVELAYAKQNNMPYASVQNKAGKFIEPTVEATTAAAEGAAADVAKNITAPIANAGGDTAYPIAGFTYLLVYATAKNPKNGAALKEFLKWAVTDGQKEAAPLDYAPLPKAIADLNLKTIDTLK